MIYPDSKIAGNIALGRTKLAYAINFGLKQYFLKEYMRSTYIIYNNHGRFLYVHWQIQIMAFLSW